MTEEDKQLIAKYMGWQPYPPACVGDVLFYVDTTTYRPIRWDLNDAALCVQEMQKRGDDYVKFIKHAYDMAFDDGKMQFSYRNGLAVQRRELLCGYGGVVRGVMQN